nr:MAG TPA: hypothetical protein [Bacteriophage sp.]
MLALFSSTVCLTSLKTVVLTFVFIAATSSGAGDQSVALLPFSSFTFLNQISEL